jgi:hypothetical protein
VAASTPSCGNPRRTGSGGAEIFCDRIAGNIQPLLQITAAPKDANGFDESIKRANLAAVMVLVK